MKSLTKKELTLIGSRLGNDRNSLLIKTALVTGAREGELVELTGNSLNVDDCTIRIVANKNSSDRTIKITRELMCGLQQLAVGNQKLFDISTSRVRQIWGDLKPSTIDKPFHAFRHTFGIELYRASRDIMFVKQAMGHKSISSTMVYVACVEYDEKFLANHNALAALMN